MSTCAIRIDSGKRMVTRERFEQMVRENAYFIWYVNEGMRSEKDWCDAWKQLWLELGYYPTHTQTQQRAYELWLGRKDKQALADWLAAERRIALTFEIAG